MVLSPWLMRVQPQASSGRLYHNVCGRCGYPARGLQTQARAGDSLKISIGAVRYRDQVQPALSLFDQRVAFGQRVHDRADYGVGSGVFGVGFFKVPPRNRYGGKQDGLSVLLSAAERFWRGQ